jgi:hypothetical protein
MIIKKLYTLISLSFLFVISACGVKYTPVANTFNLNEVNIKEDIKKTAKECNYGLLFFPPSGNISAIELAQEEDMSKIVATDSEYKSYVLFNKTCTIVYGK